MILVPKKFETIRKYGLYVDKQSVVYTCSSMQYDQILIDTLCPILLNDG